jgi:hypothetical protein
MAEQVNGAINGMQPCRLDTVVDCVSRQANAQKLGAGDDAQLPRCELCDLPRTPRTLAANSQLEVVS